MNAPEGALRKKQKPIRAAHVFSQGFANLKYLQCLTVTADTRVSLSSITSFEIEKEILSSFKTPDRLRPRMI